MNYEEAKSYILEVPKFTSKNLLQETRAFYEALGCPGLEKKIVHIAGTNGKGSVCAYLSSVYQKAGYHVAMFTSPHLVSIRERFRIDGKLISREEFTEVFERVQRLIRERKGAHPTFFELLFFMAMVYFEQHDVDVILLETGLGGRLDATNCVDKKDVCVITEIGLDHMEYLGESIREIAGEKAGIMRRGIPTVYTRRENGSEAVFKEKAAECGCPLILADLSEAENLCVGKNSIDFYLHYRYDGYVKFIVPFSALYQVENAITAIRVVETLQDKLPVALTDVQQGIAEMKWEGRMEEIRPGIYLDGAHNEDGIKAFIETVKRQSCTDNGKRLLLFSAVSDKRYHEMAKLLADSGLFSEIYLTEIGGKRKTSLEELKEGFLDQHIIVQGYEDTKDALAALLAQKKADDLAYIAGSLYLVGEIKSLLAEHIDD